MAGGFDVSAVFDDDYLYFFEDLLEQRADAEAGLIWSLAGLQPGDRVLDLACGHGRIANRLAERGARVVGLDATAAFLERARRDAARRGVDVEYVHGDMRSLPWSAEFDAVVNWFTAFGYFDDASNRDVLAAIHTVLHPGGRLLLELNHWPGLLRVFLPVSVQRRGDDAVFDEHRFDAGSGRVHARRTVVRDGRVRVFEFSTRMFAFPELRDWLAAAGFAAVEAFDGAGDPLALDSRRMVVRAQR